jgi:hypothetical protein
MLLRVLLALCLLLAVPAWDGAAGNDNPSGHGHAQKKEETVAFNVKTRKYHCLRCYYVKRCTRNCIEVSLSDAKARGGVACKVCGGTCG